MTKPEHMAQECQAHCIDSLREIIPDFLPLLGYMFRSLILSDVVNFTIHLLFQVELTHH